MILHRRLNYRNIFLSEDNAGAEHVGYRLKSGEYDYSRWFGFLDINQAKRLPGARPIKLQVWAYQKDLSKERVDLKEGEHLQGCFFQGMAFAVLVGGLPRII